MREGPETKTIELQVCNGCKFMDARGLTTCEHPIMMDHMCNIIRNHHEDTALTPEWCPLR